MSDTIAAIATALSPGGIGIIKISGDAAITTADRLFEGKSKKPLAEAKGNTIHYGYIKKDDRILEEVLVSVFKKPYSYTGEDVVEINCHGGVLALKSVLDAVLDRGVRQAEPGEFTKRAYLNGRIDISQAEAVMDIISAKSQYALESSISQLNGALKGKIEKIRDELLERLAYLESALDDPEHISLDGFDGEMLCTLRKEKEELNKLILSSHQGKYIEEGIATVILGRPNVGKSSVLNMLLGRERAIVTDVPGTTRDIIEENVAIGKALLKITDTAGIHSSDDTVEKIGMEMAMEKAKGADLILLVLDSSEKLSREDLELFDFIKEKKAIVLLNKQDLPENIREKEIKEIWKGDICPVSAETGEGADKLRELIQNMFFKGEISFNDQVYITNIRHKRLLEEAFHSLELVKETIDNNMPKDFISIDLREAIDALNEIIGGDLSEDLVEEIFSKFCMGK